MKECDRCGQNWMKDELHDSNSDTDAICIYCGYIDYSGK